LFPIILPPGNFPALILPALDLPLAMTAAAFSAAKANPQGKTQRTVNPFVRIASPAGKDLNI
jgi:hypothetical protein